MLPRVRAARKGRILREATDYFGFWKVVNEIAGLVKPVSTKEWPGIPVYLTVDHFWHWIVGVWERKACGTRVPFAAFGHGGKRAKTNYGQITG